MQVYPCFLHDTRCILPQIYLDWAAHQVQLLAAPFRLHDSGRRWVRLELWCLGADCLDHLTVPLMNSGCAYKCRRVGA